MRAPRTAVALLTGVVFLGGVISLGVSPDFRHEVRLSVSRQSGGYSDLAFVDPVHLPRSIAQGVPATMRFSIRNRSGATMTYRVAVTVEGDGPTQTLLREQVRVRDGESATRSLTFTPSRAGQFRVVVVAGSYLIHHRVVVP